MIAINNNNLSLLIVSFDDYYWSILRCILRSCVEAKQDRKLKRRLQIAKPKGSFCVLFSLAFSTVLSMAGYAWWAAIALYVAWYIAMVPPVNRPLPSFRALTGEVREELEAIYPLDFYPSTI